MLTYRQRIAAVFAACIGGGNFTTTLRAARTAIRQTARDFTLHRVKRQARTMTRVVRAAAAAGSVLVPVQTIPLSAAAAGIVSVLWSVEWVNASVYYVNGLVGSDSNAGTNPLAPRLTLPLDAGVGNGDSIYVTGNARGSRNYVGKTGLTLAQWDGQPQGWCRGDTVVSNINWSLDVGNTYKATITAPAYGITAAVIGWDLNLTAEGFHKGHLTAASSLANCRATANSWWYDGAVTLYVNANGGNLTAAWNAPLTAADLVVAYCDVSAQNLIQFTSCADGTVRGLNFALNPHNAGGQGYAVYITGCSGAFSVTGLNIYDVGSHAVGILNSPGATAEFSGIVGDGMYTTNPTFLVCYGNGANTMTGIRFYNCSYTCRTYLNRAGVELVSTANHGLAVCHGDSGDHTISDVLFVNCWITKVGTYHPSAATFVTSSQVTSVSVGNAFNFDAFPVRVLRGGTVNFDPISIDCDNSAGNYSGTMAFRNVLFHVAQIRTSYGSAGRGAFSMWAGAGAATDHIPILWDTCVFVANLSGVPDAEVGQVFTINSNQTGVTGYYINPSIRVLGTNTAVNIRSIWSWNLQARKAHQVRGYLVAYEDGPGNGVNSMTWDNNGVAASNIDVKDGRAYGISTGRFAWDATYDTLAEWQSQVDSGYLNLATNPFVNASPSCDLLPSSSAWSARRALTDHVPVSGIGGTPYRGFCGAYQPGLIATSGPRVGVGLGIAI